MSVPTDRGTSVDLLAQATDRIGQSALDWLASALAGVEGPVLELRSVPDRPTQLRLSWVPDTSAPAALPSVLARADQLPVPTNAAAGVQATMCLPIVEPLDGLFTELRRVLRPAGTLAALVPSASRSLEPYDWRPSARATRRALSRALAGGPGFRHNVARDRLGWLFASADFAVLSDQRRVFWAPLPDAASAARVVAGLVPAGVWPPGMGSEPSRRAEVALADLAAPGVRLPIPLRLLVGRR